MSVERDNNKYGTDTQELSKGELQAQQALDDYHALRVENAIARSHAIAAQEQRVQKALAALRAAEALAPAIEEVKADEQDAAKRLAEAETEAANLIAGPTGDLA